MPWVAGCAVLGLLGSVAIILAGGQLAGGTVRWWLDPNLSISGNTAEVIVYAGMAALTLAWLGLARCARAPDLTPQALWVVGALWAIPLFLAAPVFSRDVYSYFAQGTLLHHGLDPYNVPPAYLAHIHQNHVLHAMDSFWQHTTAPYGPLFLGIVSLIAGAVGTHVVLGAQLVKLLGLVGLGLLAVFVPRLARTQGHDPVRATWLAVLNPLVLFALVIPGHNDLLMVGVMVAGVALAAEGRPLVGVVVCALAATIKLPAAVAAPVIAVAWAKAGRATRDRVQRLGVSALAGLAAFGLVSLITGVGVSWVTSALFSAPAKVKLAITPASGLAYTIFQNSDSSSFHTLQSVLRVGFGVLAIAVLLFLLWRTRPLETPRQTSRPSFVWGLGLALVALAWGGPAAWPWYLIWGIALLAAVGEIRTWVWCGVLIVAGAFVVKPSGILGIPLQSAPWVMAVYAVAIIAGLYTWKRYTPRTGGPGGSRPDGNPAPGGEAAASPRESALVQP